MIFKKLHVLVLWTKVTSAQEGLTVLFIFKMFLFCILLIVKSCPLLHVPFISRVPLEIVVWNYDDYELSTSRLRLILQFF